MTLRPAALVAALAATMGCAARGPAPQQEKQAEFTPLPVLEATHVTNPHDYKGKPLCQRCHLPGQAGVTGDPIALCAQCHDPAAMKHPYGVSQRDPPADLPFGAGGRIVCHTCHDPHDVKKHRAGLRLDYMQLCMRCHERHGNRTSPVSK